MKDTIERTYFAQRIFIDHAYTIHTRSVSLIFSLFFFSLRSRCRSFKSPKRTNAVIVMHKRIAYAYAHILLYHKLRKNTSIVIKRPRYQRANGLERAHFSNGTATKGKRQREALTTKQHGTIRWLYGDMMSCACEQK